MSYTKKDIQLIVNEHFDSIKESLCDKLYSKLRISADIENKHLLIDTNLLSEYAKKQLIKYANDKGIINVTDIADKASINLVLEISARKGYLEIIKFLVKSDAKIDDKYILATSASNGHLEIVKFLVESGAKIDGCGALCDSAEKGYLEIVKYLVESGATITGSWALFNSAYHGRLEVVKYLVEQGAMVNDGSLSNSAANGHLEIVKFLVQSGATINGTNALSNSAANGHLEIVKFLVQSGATINSTNALYWSARNGHLEIVKFLVKHYLEQKLAIPDNCITKDINDINRFLFMHCNENQHHLFNEEIVSSLSLFKI